MAVDVLQSKKEEVAKSMLDDFKKELNFFQSTIIGFFDKKITQTIISNVQIGTSLEDAKSHMNFFEKLLAQVSPSTAEKVLLFIKEKQEQLVKANTIEELDNLKQGIIIHPPIQPEPIPQENPNTTPIPTDKEQQEKNGGLQDDGSKKTNNVVTGVTVGGGLGLSVLATEQIYKLQQKNKIASTIDIKDAEGFAKRLKSQFMDVSEELKKESKNFKLLKSQQDMMKKSAKEFEKIANDLDSKTFTATDMLYKLEKRLPQSLLKSIDAEDAAKLGKLISEDADFIAKLTKSETTIEEIQILLKNKGLKNINKEVVQAMKAMRNIEELKGMAYVFTNMKGIKSFMKGIRGIAFLDLISTGFDVWVLNEGLDEAESYKKLNALRASTAKEHQQVQFGVSLASTALSIIASCATVASAGGPIGTAVGAVLGVASFAASQAIDIYYDKVEFYTKNIEEFKQEYRTEIKQSIISSAASEERNLNMSERLTAMQKKAGYSRFDRQVNPFGCMSLTEKDKLTTTEDGRKALIWQEEYKGFPLIAEGFGSGKLEGEFVAALNPADQEIFKNQQKELNIIIDKRMEYVKKYMYENKGSPGYTAFVSAMKNNLGIKAIEKILADSKVYYQMSQTGTEQYISGAETIAEYKQKFGEKLKTEFPEEFADLERMRMQTPYAVLELSAGVNHYADIFAAIKENPVYIHKDKVPQMEKNISFVKRYMEYRKLSLPIEEQQKLDVPLRGIDLPMIQNIIINGNFSAIGAISFNSGKAKDYFIRNRIAERVDVKTEYSGSVGQNIIYRIAKEIHGYEGNNDMNELMGFFSEDKGSALGLYYSNGWKINNDRAIDKSITIDDMDAMGSDDILKMRMQPSGRNTVLAIAFDPMETIKASLLPGSGAFIPQSLFGFRDDAARIDTKADAGDMDKKMNLEYRSRLRRIICEEKGYASPEGKKLVETSVIEYIKKYSKPVYKADQENGEPDASSGQESGYVELPYYLIMAAKKAKIGDMEHFIFKYQDDKITACTSYIHTNDVLNFSETKTAISKEYVDMGQQMEYKQAMPYIAYVDQAKNRFSELININGNDLDLPLEYRKIYEEKIKDRERYKYSLLSMDPKLAQQKLLSEYQIKHDRFEGTYTAMLLKISTFSLSNDIDDAQYLQQIENRAHQMNNITIENGIIKGSTEMLSNVQSRLLYAELNERKPRNQNILTLAKSSDPEDKNKAIRAIKQIVKSIMEAHVADFNEDDSISSIVHGRHKGFESKMLPKEQRNREKIEEIFRKRVAINCTTANYFTPPTLDAPEIDYSKIQIVPAK